jgi:hypothetical protein
MSERFITYAIRQAGNPRKPPPKPPLHRSCGSITIGGTVIGATIGGRVAAAAVPAPIVRTGATANAPAIPTVANHPFSFFIVLPPERPLTAPFV